MSTRTALHLPIFRRRPGGLGRWGSDSSATGRVSASCMGCRLMHANGAVTVAERRLIRSSSSIRVINVVTSSMHLQRATATTVFALLVRNSRRVVGLSIARRCWRRPAALRAHRRRGLQPSRSPLASRLVLELAHLALAVRHRAPAYVPSPCSVVSCLRRPRSCCRCAGGAHRGGRNRPT